MYVCTNINICRCEGIVYMCAHVHIYIYLYIYIYIYIYTHISIKPVACKLVTFTV